MAVDCAWASSLLDAFFCPAVCMPLILRGMKEPLFPAFFARFIALLPENSYNDRIEAARTVSEAEQEHTGLFHVF